MNFKYIYSFSIISIFFYISAYAAIPEIILKQKNTIVTVLIKDHNENITSSGTGFFIDANGQLITNYHVVSDFLTHKNMKLQAKSENGFYLLNGRIESYDENIDLAIIKFDANNVPTVKISESYIPKQGENIFVIGSPMGFEYTISEGVISNIRPDLNLIQISAPISRGSSGSPVFNTTGEVIGVASSSVKNSQNLNFAIPINNVKKLHSDQNVKSNSSVEDARIKLAKLNIPFTIENFMVSIRNSDIHSVKLFINAGIDLNTSCYGKTPLNLAFDFEHQEIIKLLIENGANANVINSKNIPIINWAIQNNNKELVELLLKKNTNLQTKDSNGINPLICSARAGNKDIMELLIKFYIPDIDTYIDKNGSNALINATDCGKLEIIKLLANNKANVNFKNNYGLTALMIASRNGHIEIVKWLVKNSAEVNIIDNEGNTAIMYASMGGYDEIFKLLLDNGANIKIKSNNGKNVLMQSTIEMIELYKQLKKSGYNYDFNEIDASHKSIAKLCLANGLNINDKDNDRKNALYYAIELEHYETIKFLLENGADINIKIKGNKKLIDYAKKNKDIYKLIINSK